MEEEKREQDQEVANLRKQLDCQFKLIVDQKQLFQKLQMFNEVSQEAITNGSQTLARRNAEKTTISISIDDNQREHAKLEKRNNFISNEIKNCIPTMKTADGALVPMYDPEEVTILPEQHRKYNIPNSQYVSVNKKKIRSDHAFFSEHKNPIVYSKIRENRD